jgi:diguanylate cyclase (GGDEF)-like protein
MRWLLATIVIWSLSQVIATVLTSAEAQSWVAPFAYLGIAGVPVAWFLFCITYSLGNDRLAPAFLIGILLVPGLTVMFAFSNSYHDFIWASVTPTNIQGFIGFDYTYGIWWYINAAYSYTLILIGTSIIGFTLVQTHSHRRPLFAVIAAPAVVVALNVVYLSPQNPLPGLDLTTAGFALATLILHNWVLRHGMLSTRKIVRQRVVEELREGVMVVNSEGLILDANPMAMEILELENDLTFNQPFQDLVSNLSLIELVTSHRRNTEVGLKGRSYEVTVTRLDEATPRSDAILVFRDVTDRRKAEHELRKATYKLKHAAHTDALTGLHNRRIFMQRLDEEAERVRRHGSELSVLLFDLDHFKKVNDSFGHGIGDLVLQLVADVTEDVKRITDVAARTGGEEFALLLPETDREGAIKLAQRLRSCIEESSVPDGNGGIVKVTTSIGVATVNQIGDSVDGFLREADLALYRAKNGGRNKVCISRANAA